MSDKCPKCESENTEVKGTMYSCLLTCKDCGHKEFEID